MRVISAALKVLSLFLLAGVLILVAFRVSVEWREVDKFGHNLPEEGRLLSTGEGEIFIVEEGDPSDPLVLFAHGTGAWSGLWHPTLKRMAQEGYYAVAYDMPPFGYSAHSSDGDYSLKRQAERSQAIFEAFDQKPIVVAHSFGAGPASEAILSDPDAVSGLVIVSGAISISDQPGEEPPQILKNDTVRMYASSLVGTNPLLTGFFLRKFIYLDEAATPEIVDVLKRPSSRIGYTREFSNWLPGLFQKSADALHTSRDQWQSLSLPVALIWGTEDDVTPLRQGERLQAAIGGSEMFVLDGVGHIPQIEAPHLFQEGLIKALLLLAK